MAITVSDYTEILIRRMEAYANVVPARIDLWSDWQKAVPAELKEGGAGIEWKVKTSESGQFDRSGARLAADAPTWESLQVDVVEGLSGLDISDKAWRNLQSAQYLSETTQNEIDSRVTNLEARLPEKLEIELWGDGTGRKAKVVSANDTTKVVVLTGAFSDGTLYPGDGVKLLCKGDKIDFGPVSGALTGDDCTITDLSHYDGVTATTCNITCAAADDLSGVGVGDYVYLHNNRAVMTEAAGVITVTTAYEMFGLEAMVGDGATDATTLGQGLYSIYGKSSADFAEHKSFVKRGATYTAAWTWTDKLQAAFEENILDAGFMDGNPHGNGKNSTKVLREPVLVNGKQTRPVWMICSPRTKKALQIIAMTTSGSLYTVFREINADDKVAFGMSGDLVYMSDYFGPTPVKTYRRCPDGKVFYIRPDQMNTYYQGDKLIYWKPSRNGIWADDLVNYGLANEHRATAQSNTQVYVKARNRAAVMLNINIA